MKLVLNALTRLRSILRKIWKPDRREVKNLLSPSLPKPYCQIIKGKDPCYETAQWLMTIRDQNGYCNIQIPVCNKHHPDKDFWVRRHCELKGTVIISVESL